jgi:uncharacterized repeat protein (TIGR04138 family)
MQKLSFSKVVEEILAEDTRYDARAFAFVREGLDYTLKTLKRSSGTASGHVSGQELLEGLRDYTLREFGPMGKMVLNEWGIYKCDDFGQIVFHLVNRGVLGKSENDSPADFQEIWSFEEAFVKPFLPSRPTLKTAVRKARSPRPRLAGAKKNAAKKSQAPNAD